MAFSPPVSLALRDVLGADPAAWVAAHAATPYDARPVSARFTDAAALSRALDAGDTEALGCVVAMAASRPEDVRTALTAAVLADPSLHGDELLVLACLRHHTTVASPAALRAALPFLTRRWVTAQTGLDRSPCAQRAELLAAHLDEAEPFMARAPLDWPTLDDPDAPWPAAGDDPPVVGRLVQDVWPAASPAVRERLRAFCVRYHHRAATQRARLDAAHALLQLGDPSLVEAQVRSAIPLLRTHALSTLLEHAPFATLAREGARLFSPGAARDELLASLRRWEHVAVCASSDGEHIAVTVTGRPHGPPGGVAPGRTRAGWLHAPTGAWEVTWEVALPLYAGARLSLPAPREAVLLLRGHTRDGAARRYFFVDAAGAPNTAATAKEMKSLRSRAAAP